ncbi:hypothetical protein EUX98_g2601, partial [Antrodiella citrinella]
KPKPSATEAARIQRAAVQRRARLARVTQFGGEVEELPLSGHLASPSASSARATEQRIDTKAETTTSSYIESPETASKRDLSHILSETSHRMTSSPLTPTGLQFINTPDLLKSFQHRNLAAVMQANSGPHALDPASPLNQQFLDRESYILSTAEYAHTVKTFGRPDIQDLYAKVCAHLDRAYIELEIVKEREWERQQIHLTSLAQPFADKSQPLIVDTGIYDSYAKEMRC